MPHVPRVAKKQDTLTRLFPTLLDWRKEGVRHASQPVVVESLLHGDVERRWEMGNDVVENVLLKVGRERRLHVDQHARVVFRDLVEENGAGVLDENNRAVFVDGEVRVFEYDTDKMALGFWLAAGGAHDGGAEVGEAPVRDDGEVAKESFLLHRALLLTRRAHAQNAPGDRALDQLCHRRFDDLDALRDLRLLAQRLYESSVVEAASGVTVGVGNVDRLAIEHDRVAVTGDGVNALDARLETKFLERGEPAWLKELTDNPVGLCEGAFEETYPQGFVAGDGGKRVG